MRSCIVFSILCVAILALASPAFAEYKPGVYKAQAYGKKTKKHSGLIEVEVTLSADKIEEIKVLGYDQSTDHKKYGPPVTEAKDKIPGAIIAGQSLEVEAVAKATLASNALQLAVAKALHEATIAYKPGTYKGLAHGRKDKKHSGLIEVEVSVSANKIENIVVLSYDQSVDHKKYGPAVTEAKEKIPAAIVANQSLQVDTVADATLASNALELAVAKALAQAR